MNKNKNSTIALIVLLSVIVLLLLGIMVSSIVGSVRITDLFTNGYNSEKYSDTFEFEASEIKCIDVDSDYGDVKICEGTDDKITVKGKITNNCKLSAKPNGDVLEIERSYSHSPVSFAERPKVDTVIYIPKGFEGRMDIDTDYGNITSDSSLNGTFDFQTDMGNIKLKSISGSFDLFTNMGNIIIDSTNITANSTAQTDMGNVEISHTNPVNIVASTDLGNCKISGSDSSSPIILNVESDMGNVKINN